MTDGILVRNVIFYLYKIALNKEKLMVVSIINCVYKMCGRVVILQYFAHIYM